MNDDFIPSEVFMLTLKKWWVLALLMILGGIGGLFFTRLNRPIFQSQAAITTSIDFAYSGRITDVEQDHLIMAIGDEIGSTKVINQVVNLAGSEKLNLTKEEIQKSLTLSRKGYRWVLTARNTNASNAQKLAQLWADAALQTLVDVKKQTLVSYDFHTGNLALESCLAQSVVTDPVSASCSLDQLEKIRAAMSIPNENSANMSLTDTISLSKISFELTQQPELADSPIFFQQNLTVIVGAVIGLLVGIGWNFTRKHST
jgi:uncharacterized protein involved in exopolysaccharide biosynthesis